MLALALALLATAPTAVTASGMEPQLSVIRLKAAERGWPITCVGHAGEAGVVRIAVPAGTPRTTVDKFMDSLATVASSVGDLGVSTTTCDEEPIRQESWIPTRTLVFGVRDPDARLEAIARACGYRQAHWRATRPEDVARYDGRVDAAKYPFTLDAGEDAAARIGPMTCFDLMGVRPLLPARPFSGVGKRPKTDVR